MLFTTLLSPTLVTLSLGGNEQKLKFLKTMISTGRILLSDISYVPNCNQCFSPILSVLVPWFCTLLPEKEALCSFFKIVNLFSPLNILHNKKTSNCYYLNADMKRCRF